MRKTLLVVLIAYSLLVVSDSASAQAPAEDETQTARIAAFEKSLSGSVLVGRFSITGRGDNTLKEERYEIKSVKHVEGEVFLFTARIAYGDHDVTVPLPLPVRWAGDTPVICLDKMLIPGLGTYSARVMFHEDHYAGYWDGGDHGGHLFGVIEHSEAKPAE